MKHAAVPDSVPVVAAAVVLDPAPVVAAAVVLDAPINVQACLHFAKKLAMRKLFHGPTSYGHTLVELAGSAQHGRVLNAFAETRSSAKLGIGCT